jgi:tRNA(His) 5'-end guanylyltransferase
MDKTALGNRMKGYEVVTKQKVMRRTPVVIRLDGKAFHTWTKILRFCDESLDKSPFSEIMHQCMSSTALQLVNSVQNARLTYTQSDEISILLNDWGKLKTDQWFDGNIQKMVSISASMTTALFNKAIEDNEDAISTVPALFDARVFNLPVDEVANYFVWRQQDATRNSINMLGQFYFSHKELQGKNTDQVQEMLFSKHGVNWNDIPTWQKRGYCSTRDGIDDDIPVFTQDRDYIEQHLRADDEW